MNHRLIVLRPEPGASRTLAKAAALGLDAMACPMFRVEPLEWTPPAPESFDVLLITSAQAVWMSGDALARYRALPAYAVGQASAAALREAGFAQVTAGDADGAAIAARIAADGYAKVLHLAGADVAPFDPGTLTLSRIAVYTAVETGDADALTTALVPDAVLLVHSPRAGRRLQALTADIARETLHIVAISPAALAACGDEWASAQAAKTPDDTAMLALASLLCKRHGHARYADGGTGSLDHR